MLFSDSLGLGWRVPLFLGFSTIIIYALGKRRTSRRRQAQEVQNPGLKTGLRLNLEQDASLKAQSNYADPATLVYHWPFALDLLLEARRADQAGSILNFFLALMRRTGDTFEQILLGARGIDTHDPENLEAILSTQFQSQLAPQGIVTWLKTCRLQFGYSSCQLSSAIGTWHFHPGWRRVEGIAGSGETTIQGDSLKVVCLNTTRDRSLDREAQGFRWSRGSPTLVLSTDSKYNDGRSFRKINGGP